MEGGFNMDLENMIFRSAHLGCHVVETQVLNEYLNKYLFLLYTPFKYE